MPVSAHYDADVVAEMQTIGSFFVDVFFNHIYAAAAANRPDNVAGEFTSQVRAYILAVKSDRKSYVAAMQALTDHCKDVAGWQVGSTAALTDHIAALFVPPQHYMYLDARLKDEKVAQVVVNLVGSLGVFARSEPMVRLIVDQHDAKHASTIQRLLEHSVDVLFTERTRTANLLLRGESQAKGVDVSAEALNDLRRQVEELASAVAQHKLRNARAERKLRRAAERLGRTTAKLRSVRAAASKLKEVVRRLLAEREVSPAPVPQPQHVPRPSLQAPQQPQHVPQQPQHVPQQPQHVPRPTPQISYVANGRVRPENLRPATAAQAPRRRVRATSEIEDVSGEESPEVSSD